MTATELRAFAADQWREAKAQAKDWRTAAGAEALLSIAKACDLAADILDPSDELVRKIAENLGYERFGTYDFVVTAKLNRAARAVLAALADRLESKP